MFNEWKRGDCQKKLRNGAHQEKENEVDLNLPGRKRLEQRFPNFLTRGALCRINFYGGAP